MIPLTPQEINDFEPCSDSDCDDDICAFSRELSAARGKIEEMEALLLRNASGQAWYDDWQRRETILEGE